MRLAAASLLAAAVQAAAPAPGPSPAASPVRARADLEAAVVEIVGIPEASGGARLVHGSAFYVTPHGCLVTCAHVLDHVRGEEARRLRLPDGRERAFEVVKVDRELDLALLSSAPPERFLVLAGAALPLAGDRTLLAGYAARTEGEAEAPSLLLRAGQVAGLERRRVSDRRRTVGSRRAITTVLLDQVAVAGQSGGPLLGEDTLEALGILRSNLESATGGLEGARARGHAVAVPAVYLREFLARAGVEPPAR